MKLLENDIAIVLTATIVPNTIFVAHLDPMTRRDEYLNAVRYYSKFAHVYLLENSSYDILSDKEFIDTPNLSVRKIPESLNRSNGKGFQEFQMLDYWLDHEELPPDRWIKISGRYIYQDFNIILKECLLDQSSDIIIDQSFRLKAAYTTLFCLKTDFYRNYLRGIYTSCNDLAGNYIEYVLYRCLASLDHNQVDFRIFKGEPRLQVVSGTYSVRIDYRKNIIQFYIRSMLRTLNFALNKKYIVYSYVVNLVAVPRRYLISLKNRSLKAVELQQK
jgi:hypothetical protein